MPAAVQSAWLSRDPVGFLEQCRRRFGDIFSLRVMPVGDVVVVHSPGLVHDVLTGRPDRFLAGAATGRLLPFLGARSPLLLDGDAHRAQRRRLLPAFSPHGAAGDREAIEAIVRRHVERWPRGTPFPVLPLTRSLALEVVVHHAVGLRDVDVEGLEDRLQELLTGPARLALRAPRASRAPWHAAPRAMLERRLAALDRALAEGAPAADERADDVLSALGGGDGRARVDERERLDVLRALALVGHETTGTAASWLLRLVGRQGDETERLRRAVSDGDDARIRSFVEETLRVHPPVVDAVREAGADMELGGRAVRRGTIVMAAPVLLHTRADVYDDPCAFRPERFVDRRPEPAAWIPFGGGVRRCLGANLALEILQALVRVMLERGSPRVACGPPERAKLSGTTLVPCRGGRIALVASTGSSARAPWPRQVRPKRDAA